MKSGSSALSSAMAVRLVNLTVVSKALIVLTIVRVPLDVPLDVKIASRPFANVTIMKSGVLSISIAFTTLKRGTLIVFFVVIKPITFALPHAHAFLTKMFLIVRVGKIVRTGVPATTTSVLKQQRLCRRQQLHLLIQSSF